MLLNHVTFLARCSHLLREGLRDTHDVRHYKVSKSRNISLMHLMLMESFVSHFATTTGATLETICQMKHCSHLYNAKLD